MEIEREFVSLVGAAFEIAGVIALGLGAAVAIGAYFGALRRGERPAAYGTLRAGLGRAILLGLELLVAADILRSVALAPTLSSVAALGLLVVIRTFLSWSIEVEINGRWPWQEARSLAGGSEEPGET